ncbi:hypothetical protein Val02_64190 [Virgisporangium aliadipatigenens]|uniref:Mycothiol-dependent maleylpyruvate isomerase metal-binding domain-containing protein n=1 Tax=Virgisporangium aliadipatigenens TaxID=741659 RepID=A0A8J3YSC5_9ACTN|nr:maleylpyruvate isomerase N-terminal domain-containing protein [Virgisporangium aliadipatigenens]GIJ49533.1 hypothetical protein Val02_64190 [Virgisporangium aliadipatigenens]
MRTLLAAFTAEARAIEDALSAASQEEFDRPTRCAPWRVRDLLAHVGAAVDRVPAMLAAVPPTAGPPTAGPPAATTDAAGYYRRDRRFSPEVDAARVSGSIEAANREPHPVRRFAASWRAAHAAALVAPADRLVLTRHDDTMLLSDFMLTRVVELALHGLDLADALARPAWLSPPSSEILLGLLLPGPDIPWSAEVTIRKATGRAEASPSDRAALAAAGLRPLALSPL